MPDWDTHARVAVLLDYKPNRKVDEVIDDLKLHDIGMRVIERPSRHPEDLILHKNLKDIEIILKNLYIWQTTMNCSTSTTQLIASRPFLSDLVVHYSRRRTAQRITIPESLNCDIRDLRLPSPP